jgi:GTP-binding protein Era
MAHRSGYVAVVGRPNVGKSTLVNALVGAKVAIVSPKPQTTRTRIVGIRTLPEAQIVFIDTPGLHAPRSLINRRMVDTAEQVLEEADLTLLVLDATAGVTRADGELAARLAERRPATIVALNKLDRVRPPALLPAMARLGTLLPGRDVFPVCARTGAGTAPLLATTVAALPAGPLLYPDDEYTSATERFLAEELIREQLFIQMKREVPYGTAVNVEEFVDEPGRDLVRVRATILVDRPGHKGIVIGAGGVQLREIGRRARLGMEELLGKRVFLELFVRVEPGWAENPRRLEELGL